MAETPAEISSLLDAFKSPDSADAATTKFASMGQSAIPYLVEALKSDNEDIRIGAAFTINKMVAGHSIESIPENARAAMKTALAKEKTPEIIINLCGALLHSDDQYIRTGKVSRETFSYVSDHLLRVSEDKNADIGLRIKAISTLGGVYQGTPLPEKSDAFVERIAPQLNNQNYEYGANMRFIAADALRIIGNPKALPDLNARLDSEPVEQVKAKVREAIKSCKSNQPQLAMR